IDKTYNLGIEVLTDFPVQVGGKLWVEFPHRVRVSTSFGVLPRPYIDAINKTLVAADAYSQQEADLIKTALQSSLIWRLHIGWRPCRRRGLYFEVGYGLAAFGGGASSAQLISAATGVTVPPEVLSGQDYDVRSTLHMIDAEIGGQWVLRKGLMLETAIGFA